MNRKMGFGALALAAGLALATLIASPATAEEGDDDVSVVVPTPTESAPSEDEPIVVTLDDPVINDECGTENDYGDLPPDKEGVSYQWIDTEDDTNLDFYAYVEDGYTVQDIPAGWEAAYDEPGYWVYTWTYEFTDVACPVESPGPTPSPTPTPTPTASSTPELAITGGGDLDWGVLAAGGMLLLAGIGVLVWRRVRA